jgi:hypothetical protein
VDTHKALEPEFRVRAELSSNGERPAGREATVR